MDDQSVSFTKSTRFVSLIKFFQISSRNVFDLSEIENRATSNQSTQIPTSVELSNLCEKDSLALCVN